MLSPIKTAEWMLDEWGRWARSGHGLALTYPSIEPFERMRGSVVKNPCLSDEEAELVDRVVSELIQADKLAGDALAYYYLSTRNYRKIGQLMHVDRRRIPDLIRQGVMWTSGRITY